MSPFLVFLGACPSFFARKNLYVYPSKPHFLGEDRRIQQTHPIWVKPIWPHPGDVHPTSRSPSRQSRHLKTLRRHLLELPSTTGKDGPGLFLGFCCRTGWRQNRNHKKKEPCVLDLSSQSYFSTFFHKSVILLRSKLVFVYSDACPCAETHGPRAKQRVDTRSGQK